MAGRAPRRCSTARPPALQRGARRFRPRAARAPPSAARPRQPGLPPAGSPAFPLPAARPSLSLQPAPPGHRGAGSARGSPPHPRVGHRSPPAQPGGGRDTEHLGFKRLSCSFQLVKVGGTEAAKSQIWSYSSAPVQD
ncbi:formin-like protein 5 [Passer montanus]|uniref:formin-like protein 5 n=1 Tax=Passer montanus TaxID=9160 RepID=UPI00195FF44B|nr:formin-like protein 5 [Passer montanus]